MRKMWMSCWLAAWVFCRCPGQTLVSGEAILASARADVTVQTQEQQIAFMQGNSRGLPFVQEISARTETDRFELRRQEYLARVNVNGLNEMRRQRQVKEADRMVEESALRVSMHEALLKRYETLAGYRDVQRQWAVQRALWTVYADQILVLQKMAAANAGAEVADWIKVEFDRDEMALKMAESEAQFQALRQQLREYLPVLPGEWALDTTGFILPEQMEAAASNLPLTELQNPEAVEKQRKIGQIDAQYALRKAGSQRMLDFFQLRYHSRPDEGFNRAFSVGVGVNLPYNGSDRVKMADLLIEKNAAGLSLQRYQAETSARIEAARQQLAALGRRHRIARQQWADSQARFTLEQGSTSQPEGPWPLLKARELQLKRQLALLAIEREMTGEYLQVLDLSGALSAAPAVNYLSEKLLNY